MIKLPFKKPDPPKPRPYWHVDAKWVCALLLIAALTVTLPVAVAHRLTARGPATEIIAHAVAGLTSTKGLDNAEGLEDIKARVIEKGSETISLGGVSVTLTPQDLETMSPRELRLKIFRAFATNFYDKGAKGIAESQGLDKAAVDKAVNDASILSAFGQDRHNQIGKLLTWMMVVDALLLLAVVFFSWRFGRLVTPGLVLVLVGLPGLLFALIAHQSPEVSGSARSEDDSNYVSAAGSFASYLAPLVTPHLASVYLSVLIPGAVLLAMAGAGKIIYLIVRRGKDKNGKHDVEDKPKKDEDKKE